MGFSVLRLFLFIATVGPSSTLALVAPRLRVRAFRQSNFLRLYQSTTESSTASYFSQHLSKDEQRRELGSQELLMLPRQYAPSKIKFPQMNHVTAVVLSATPPIELLQQAITAAMEAHPLLRCHVEGDGEPNARIDLFQMVRQGDPNPCTFVATKTLFKVNQVLSVVNAENPRKLEESWKAAFSRNLDDGSWCNVATGPLWKVELHQTTNDKDSDCALVFSFNHAISDQSSANRLIDEILRDVAELESQRKITHPAKRHDMPMSMEESVMGKSQACKDVSLKGISIGTLKYVADKAAEGFRNPVILPDGMGEGRILDSLAIISGRTASGRDDENRKSAVEFRSLSRETTSALLDKCRENNVSITNALTAAITLTATDFIDSGKRKNRKRNYKILQSLDMRRFGQQLDKGATVACMAGSMDLIHGPLPDRSGCGLRRNPSDENLQFFWDLAKEGKEQTQGFIDSNGPQHAVRVFDFAMTISDMNNLVYLTSQSKSSMGRAYSAGVTNVGVYERQLAFSRDGEVDQKPIQLRHGRYHVKNVYFATPHTGSGCLYQVSCMTVDGSLQMTFHPVSPIVSSETSVNFATAFVEILEIVSGVKKGSDETIADKKTDFPGLPPNTLAIAALFIGSLAIASHADAWFDFFSAVTTMKQSVPADEFWPALNFWIFFAMGHPILEPILWISDVLHGSPGPRIADLVPVTFLLANLIVIGAISKFQDLRNAANIAAFAALLTYVGAGLDGAAGMGDYNLALDDKYNGEIIKGCPAYDKVRQPSMDNFDLEKYQGKWYEQKFHDWTQFKEVYDTTLDIKLTEGGKGWVDDFAVRGPAPDAAPLSWDKSPVGNGAHYFLFGRVDPNDPPGILREKGFGVEFPNYIVDVKKDPETGEYTEAIQFQCLERGGVRVFEGINFLSRKPVMTPEEIDAMHSRAEKAGMYPYGASPEQMHTVARWPENDPNLDNSWQRMWHAIGFDKLLELLTESIEDGGR